MNTVHYISTRANAPALPFDDVVLTGLARDGGLYLPETWPALSGTRQAALAELPYADLAAEILLPYAGDTLNRDELRAMSRDAYSGFGHMAVAPLRQIDTQFWMMELFHGQTLAFKDYALQLLGRLFDHFLAARGERVTIIGATSGDTGSAAIEAVRDRANVDIFMLHPKGRVSEVQRRQMTTVPAGNVFNIAIDGSFDDCQNAVKALFADQAFRDRAQLAAVNSINWARIAAQIVYYAAAALQLGRPDRPVSFAVPTGNFGNVLAAYAAKRMGLPIGKLVIGCNTNDILHRFFETGAMTAQKVTPTIAPSMDIQISSNFERYLFELLDRDGARLSGLMAQFREQGEFRLEDGLMARARADFASHRFDDDAIRATIAKVRADTGMIVDPHTAIGIAAAEAERTAGGLDGPVVALACAHPAKFPDAVERACGVRPALPEALSDLLERPERVYDMANNLDSLKQFISGHARILEPAA